MEHRRAANLSTEANDDSTDGRPGADPDWVGAIAGRWRVLRPDLDPSPLLVLGRIQRIAALTHPLLRPTLAAAGLADGDFDLLAALRRQGPPHEASPGALTGIMLVTSGATSKRTDRLEGQGLVTRRAASADGRRRVVALTDEGLRLVDRLIGAHLANEAAILAPMSPERRTRLAELLGELAAIIEGDTDQPGDG